MAFDSTRLRSLSIGLLILAVGSAAPSVSAQPAPAPKPAIDEETRNSARKLGEEGNKLFAENDFAGALDRYQRAEQLVSVPTLGVRIARCLAKLGRLVEATEKYVQVTRTELASDALPQHVEAVAQARAELEALKPRVPSVVVRIEPADGPVEVTIDDKPLPPALIGAGRSIDPGKHRIVAKRGDRTEEATLEIAEGEAKEVTIDVGAYVAPADAPAAGGPSEPLLISGIALLALGGGSLIAFGVTGGLALGKESELRDSCGEALACGPAFHEDADGYNDMRLASTVTLWLGVGLAAAGTALVVAGSVVDSGDATVGLRVGPGGASITGTF